MPADEGICSQVEDQTAIHLLVKVKIKVIQRLLRIANLRLLATSLQQSFATAGEFVRYQTGDQIDGRPRFGLLVAEIPTKAKCIGRFVVFALHRKLRAAVVKTEDCIVQI
jgi:hypothetical protein